jgi:hypothetical protein
MNEKKPAPELPDLSVFLREVELRVEVRFPWLHRLAAFLRVVAWIGLIAPPVVAVVVAVINASTSSRTAAGEAAVTALSGLLAGVATFIVAMLLSETVRLFLAIEENTRNAAEK